MRFLGFFKEDDETSDSEAEEGQFAAIGEPVVLQTSWKEPPFAITVLGPPERVDGERERIRVPVRYTGIVHRWSHFSVGGYPAVLYTSENADGERLAWESEYGSEWGPSFEEFVLIEGGTHDRYLYFRAGEDEERKTGDFWCGMQEVWCFQLAEVAVSREVFRQVLERIAGLHPALG